MKHLNAKGWLFAVLVSLVIILGAILHSKLGKIKVLENNFQSIQDSLKVVIHKDSSKTSSIRILEAIRLNDLLKIKSKDSAIIALQKAVKSSPKSSTVVVYSSSTGISTTTPTVVTDSTNPIYTSNIDLNGWVTGTSVATKDSTSLSLSIKNEYEMFITDGQVYIKDKNPYSSPNYLRAGTIPTPKTKRFIIGPSAGVQWDFYSGKVRPYVGFGATYKIFGF